MIAIALMAALPSLVWGFWGGTFLSDDWVVWSVFEERGLLDGAWQLSFEQPARPLAGPYYAITHGLVNDRPVVHGVFMAVAHGGMVLSAWWAVRSIVPRHVLLAALAVIALVPNHASIRFWFVTSSYAVAVVLVIVGFGLLIRRRTPAAAAVFVCSTLLYEGAVGLTVFLVGAWFLADHRSRLRRSILVAAPVAVAAAGMLALSPKRDVAGADPFANAGTFLPGQISLGFWGHPGVAEVGALALLGFVAASLVWQLPSFRRSDPEYRWALIGAAMMLVSAAPFVYSGSIFATAGIFDRNNLVPGFGVALIAGALWARIWRWGPVVATALAPMAVALFVSATWMDLADYRDAGDEGALVLSAVASEAPGAEEAGIVLVGPEPPGIDGVADFVYPGDLVAALRFRHGGDWSHVHVVSPFTDCAWPEPGPGPLYTLDHRNGRLTEVESVADLAEQCDEWRV